MNGRETMELREMVALFSPETQPATELVRGRMLQKVSPQRAHSQLTLRLAAALEAWNGGRGEVGIEWRFYFAPAGANWGSLVPDLSFVAAERLAALTPAVAETPPFAPDVAIEIVSPDDRRIDVEWKTEAYLYGGTKLVLVVDPRERQIRANDANGRRIFDEHDRFEHPALPGFSLSLAELFEGVFRG